MDKEILMNIGKVFSINKELIDDFFNADNIKKVNSYIAIAKEKKISGVPFFEVRKNFFFGARSFLDLERVIRSYLS